MRFGSGRLLTSRLRPRTARACSPSTRAMWARPRRARSPPEGARGPEAWRLNGRLGFAARRLARLGEELDQAVVELHRALEHRHVAGVIHEDLAGVRDEVLELVGVLHGHEHVLLAPDDQGGACDVGEAVAEVVLEERVEGVPEAGRAGGVHLLPAEGRAQAGRGAPPQTRPPG